MQKTFCDKCNKETINYPHTRITLERGFLKKSKQYILCEECDQKLYNIIIDFLNK